MKRRRRPSTPSVKTDDVVVVADVVVVEVDAEVADAEMKALRQMPVRLHLQPKPHLHPHPKHRPRMPVTRNQEARADSFRVGSDARTTSWSD